MKKTIQGGLLCFACLFVFVFSNAASAASDPDEDDAGIKQIIEVQKKYVTLRFLADPRSKDLLNVLLKDLSPQLKRNFRANITGAFKKILLENFQTKINEVCDDTAKLACKDILLFNRILSSAEKTPFPLDLGFSPVLKKLSDFVSFQMAQRAGLQTMEGLPAMADRICVILTRLEDESVKDPYNAVKQMYATTPLTEIPIWWYDDAQYDDVGYETHGSQLGSISPRGKKNWTVLVFLNADNNLESSGLKDLNEMEMVGPDKNFNMVVEIDRMKSGEGNDITDANWTGARRYEVVKETTKKIGSRMVMNLGERDMGSRKELADFLSWGVENYPAKHFLVVVWNHGSGWQGISFDDESGKNLSTQDIVWGMSQAIPALEKVNPDHPKFDIIDFDACLMGMIEIAYEMRNVVDFMVASEETEPGQGIPYRDAMRVLKKNPEITPCSLAKAMVSTYVKSYAFGGSQTSKRNLGDSVTNSAYDLSKIAPLKDSVDRLATSLLANYETYTRLLVDAYSQFAKLRRYDDSYVDLLDFSVRLATIKELPEDTRTICLEIIKTLGYPKLEDHLSQPIIIKQKTPGYVIWGYNGWKMPSKEIWPPKTEVYHSRFAKSPLKGPTDQGEYVCEIGPFTLVVDPGQKKMEYVTEINYKILLEDGKIGSEFTARTGKEMTYVDEFPSTSPLIAEGHTMGMGNSYGISIYYPYYLDFQTSYKTLKFAKETEWDEFLSKVPRYKANADILLTGGMIEDPSTLLPFLDALDSLKVPVDVLWDPKVFGYKFGEIFTNYKNGLVITDSIAADSFGKVIPSVTDLKLYLDLGGNLMIAAQSVEQSNSNMPMLEEYFKFKYIDDDRDLPKLKFQDRQGKSLELTLNGEDSAKSAADVTIMECEPPAVPFVTTEDGRGASIFIAGDSSSGNKYRALLLGFRFEAVDCAANRTALLDKTLEMLLPELKTSIAPPEPAQ